MTNTFNRNDGTFAQVDYASVSGTPIAATTTLVLQAHMSGNQTVTPNTFTIMAIDTVTTDTQSGYSTSTKKYTPTVSGIYFFQLIANANATTAGIGGITLIKNDGGAFNANYGGLVAVGLTIANDPIILSMNGSTDYIRAWGYTNSGVLVATNPTLLAYKLP